MKISEFFIDKSGFRGQLYEPKQKQDKAIIIFMGGEGKIISAGLLAEKLSNYGYSALALYYCKGKGLSKKLSEIPLEMVEKAIVYLKKNNYKKIGTYGISLGSVLAFMSGIVFSDISCVIGVSPTCIIPEGFISLKYVSGKSFLTYQGKPYPFVPLENDVSNYERFQNVYNHLSDNQACIPIEKINGRILLLAGIRDESWNSVYAITLLKARLERSRFSFPYKTCIYDGSHYIGVIPDMRKYKALNLIKLISKEERKNKKQCEVSRNLSEQEIIKWLKEW